MDVNSNERRRQTRSNVYHYLYGAQEFCTRQSLAQALDLSLPTIYQNLTDLVDAGLVRYAGQSQSTGGRKASGLAIVPDARVAVGIALTEDRLRFSAADLRLNEIAYHKVSHTSNFEMEELGALVARELEQFLEQRIRRVVHAGGPGESGLPLPGKRRGRRVHLQRSRLWRGQPAQRRVRPPVRGARRAALCLRQVGLPGGLLLRLADSEHLRRLSEGVL